MNTETQNLIVTILGFYAIISLIGIVVLAILATNNNELILSLVPVTITPISILGGFIAGKNLTEKQEESLMGCNQDNTLDNEMMERV